MAHKKMLLICTCMLSLLIMVCSKTSSPQKVSEAFLFRYFIELNQRGALELCTGLATKKLQKEIELTQNIRMQPNLNLEQAKPFLDYEFREMQEGRDGAFALHYDITIENSSGKDHKREVVITTIRVGGRWLVKNYDTFVQKP